MSAEKTGEQGEVENADELHQIFTLLAKLRRRCKGPLKFKHAVLGQQLYPVPVDQNAHFQVWAMAPSGSATELYEDGIMRCFDGDRLKEELPRSHHNLVSIGLLIIFRRTRIILGGDVERSGWADVVEEFGADKLVAHAVKVSHHGSSGAFDETVWRHHAADGKPLAIVTPFERFGLPEKNVMERIEAHASDVLITHYAPYVRAHGCSLETVAAIWDEFGARTASAAGDFGRCTLVFDGEGKCENPVLVAPAMKWADRSRLLR